MCVSTHHFLILLVNFFFFFFMADFTHKIWQNKKFSRDRYNNKTSEQIVLNTK